ncbi:hypothetical protein A33M_0965 [Rhodovulum sp. PH10]|nr:hypothetical protein A33M_0965 [Rhodovulum sp. PH10]
MAGAPPSGAPRQIRAVEFDDRDHFLRCPAELVADATHVVLARVHPRAARQPRGSLTYVRSADSEGLAGEVVKDGIHWLPLYDRDPVNVLQFGAAGDGQTDDIAALEVARDFALGFGGEVEFPAGNYRITRTFRIGPPRWRGYEEQAYRTNYLKGAEQAPLHVDENLYANYRLMAIGLRARGAVNIIADFTADRLTPVVEYNVMSNLGVSSIVGPFRVIPPALFDGRRYRRNSGYKPTGNLIGWAFNGHGVKRIQGIAASGMTIGAIAVSLYWSSLSDMHFEACGDCLNVPNANAMRISNVVMWYSERGLVIDGAASYVGQIHAQQVGQELVVPFAECCDFEDCYFEDASKEPSPGTHAVTLGLEPNAGKRIIATQMRSVRVGARRPGKRSFVIRTATGLTLNGCREYSGGVDADQVSNGILIGTDFAHAPALPGDRFTRL